MEPEQIQAYLTEQMKEAMEKGFDGDRLPSLKLEPDKLTTFDILMDGPFEQWVDPANGAIKKIIKIKHEGKLKVFWINVANPCYKSILESLKEGNHTVSIMRTGKDQNTKYTLVKK